MFRKIEWQGGESRSPIFRPGWTSPSKGVIHDLLLYASWVLWEADPKWGVGAIWGGVGGGGVCEREKREKQQWAGKGTRGKTTGQRSPPLSESGQASHPPLPSVTSQGCEECGLGSNRQPWQVPPWREVWVVHLHNCHRLPVSHQRLFAVKGSVLPWERKVRFILTQETLHKRKAIQGPENPKPDFMIFCICEDACNHQFQKTQLKMAWTIKKIYNIIQ